MTALAALAIPSGAAADPRTARGGAAATTRAMLDAMPGRGGELREETSTHSSTHSSTRTGAHAGADDGPPLAVALAAARDAWQAELHGGVPTVIERRGMLVVADASLYREPAGRAAAARVLEACDADAPDALAASIARLEGDFAFVVWDGPRRRLVAARSFAGLRPLHYSAGGGALRLASTVAGVLADPAVPRDLDLATVAAVAAGLWCHADATAYRAVREVPAGHLLLWEPGREPVVRAFWEPPSAIVRDGRSRDDAAAELRALLVDAVRVRLAPSGVTGLSLSGGWDSTAVFAAGRVALGDAPGRAPDGAPDDAPARLLQPVSISYPRGDAGREDELIEQVLARWDATTEWIEVDGIPVFDERSPARRDGPFAHAYESWNRALSRGARRHGARVMLDGVGGDQLFQVSDAYLADLFRRGRWMELRRQWRGRGGRGARNFWRWAVRPALPLALVRAISRARGAMEPPAHHFDRRPPFWFESAFLDAHGVLAREAEAVPALPRHDQVLAETHLYLRYAFFPRIIALLGDFALDEGVELRSPLLDDRVVRFAAARPWHERVDRRETKLLLRHAMRGLLPDPVLAPRPHRTGTTSHYFRRQITGPGAAFIERQLEAPLLARIGMVDAKRLRRAWEHVRQRDDESLGAALFFTVQAEAWLREHTDGSALPAPAAVPASAPPVVPHGGPAPGGKGAAA